MATIHFKGKSYVQNHYLTLKYHHLVPGSDASLTDKISLHDNLIIHGDNLLALKALLPNYAGKVKCIYIDPPYNTGEEGWVYNDNVNSPMMQEWLGKVVDKDDLTRHDKWLCMMLPRLKLLREFLSDDGVIFISIDDNEVHHLKMLMDEVFPKNFVANIVWRRTVSKAVSGKGIAVSHDYILCYGRSEETIVNKLQAIDESKYKNPDNDPRGPYKLQKLERALQGARPSMTFSIKTPIREITRTWSVNPKKYKEMLEDNRIVFSKNGIPYYKQFLSEFKGRLPDTWWDKIDGFNQTATKELTKIFDSKKVLPSPKPVDLIKITLKISIERNDVVLDSFAGTGTTAQAVLELNKEDDGNRKFILIEMEDYAKPITAERVKRVIKGIPSAKDEALKNGLGGSLSFFELGNPVEMQAILEGNNLPMKTWLDMFFTRLQVMSLIQPKSTLIETLSVKIRTLRFICSISPI